MPRVVIVGGGISGLSTAYYLRKAGIAASIVERRPRLGGVIETERVDGCVLEAGPDSFISQKPWATQLIREVGLAGDLIASNDHLRVTYVRKNGRLVPLPDGLMLMIPTKIMPMVRSGLLGWGTKVRMGLEWFRKPPANPPDDRSVAEFVADHYGQETVDYLAEPLLSGIYGGDPNRLSVGSVLPRFVELEARYGSLTKGVLHARKKAAQQSQGLPLFQTLKGGLAQLTAVLQERSAPEVIRGEAEVVEREGASWRVRVDGAWIEADDVVLACQAYEAGALVRSVEPDLAALLGGVEYSSSITISLGYDKAKLPALSGFGFLVPKRERRRMMACTFVGTKFPYRVPDDKAVLRCFVGGHDTAALALGDEALETEIRDELREILGITAEPAFVRIARWPRSMAQYTVGHARRMAHVEAHLAHLPGLYVAGNAYTGIGVPDCVRMGKAAADKIAAGG